MNMSHGMLDRRQALKAGVLGAAGVWVAGNNMGCATGAPKSQHASRTIVASDAEPLVALRVAHLSDIHVQPELLANRGLGVCLKHVMALERRPGLVVTGGDMIMDSFGQEAARTKLLWEMFNGIVKDECGVPIMYTLGNHDIWGWNKGRSKTSGIEPSWGKKWALDVLGLSTPYHSVDRNGWHIVVLDSTHPDPDNSDGYIAKLDEAQMSWLESDLSRVDPKTPVAVVSHIPIMTITHLVEPKQVKGNDYFIEGGIMHIDAAKLHRLFAKSGNVKLCLSGHIHRRDRIEMDGVTYICDGAVSGSWWKGRGDRCDEGYGVVDLMADGSFKHEYMTFGWKAATA